MLRKDIFTTFLDRVTTFPVWLQKIIYLKISQNLQGQLNSENDLTLYTPILTATGKTELEQRTCGFDLNLYNFLSYCEKKSTLFETSLNTFLTLEEISKLFLFCIDQNFIEKPKNQNIEVLAGFLAGKYRTGEYFLKNGTLTQTQLEKAVEESMNGSKKFAEILIEHGFITKQVADIILKLKEDATKRFVLDYNNFPTVQNENKEYRQEIEHLKLENQELREKIARLSENLTISEK